MVAKPGVSAGQVLTRVGLLREAGGYGDAICIGGATRAIKHEDEDTHITAFVPEEFVEVVEHLYGIDDVVSLGPIDELHSVRRAKGVLCDNYDRHEYLTPVRDADLDQVVDLWCPGELYESTQMESVAYTRSQLFAMAAGVTSLSHTIPRYVVTKREHSESAKWLEEHELDKHQYVAVAFNSSCATKRYPRPYAENLLASLADAGVRIVYCDHVMPHFDLPDGVVYCDQPWPVFASIVAKARVVLTVSTAMIHLARALDVPTFGIFGSTDPEGFKRWYGVRCSDEPMSVDTRGMCSRQCNYNVDKGWSSYCGIDGCARMLANTPKVIRAEFLSFLNSVIK